MDEAFTYGTQVGITGTQTGGTERQLSRAAWLLTDIGLDVLRHGDCVGVDAEMHEVVRYLDPTVVIVGHPPQDESKRAFAECDYWEERAPYLERNRAIVDAADYLVALPKGYQEERRSGTWSTIRYARKVGCPHAIVYPRGEMTVRDITVREYSPSEFAHRVKT